MKYKLVKTFFSLCSYIHGWRGVSDGLFGLIKKTFIIVLARGGSRAYLWASEMGFPRSPANDSFTREN